jgi:hypothetical protein
MALQERFAGSPSQAVVIVGALAMKAASWSMHASSASAILDASVKLARKLLSELH